MKAMTKQQLADYAGVSLNTFHSWCKPYQKEFKKLGLKPRAQVLPPKIVKFIAQKYCIEIE